jgi:hypothetical protein
MDGLNGFPIRSVETNRQKDKGRDLKAGTCLRNLSKPAKLFRRSEKLGPQIRRFENANRTIKEKYEIAPFFPLPSREKQKESAFKVFCVCLCLRSTLESSSCGKKTRKEMNSVFVADSEVLSSLLPAGKRLERK